MHLHPFASITVHNISSSELNLGPRRAPTTRLKQRNMEDEERAHRDAHFQQELDSLKASVASLTSLLEQVLRNAFGEGPSTRPVAATQVQATNHHEEVTGERV